MIKNPYGMRLKDWAIKQVEEWVNPYLLTFKGQVDKDGYWHDPLLHHPEGVKVFLVDIGYFGFGLMEEEFWEGWDYILKHPDASYLDIVRSLNVDDYTMGTLEGIESIENPVMIPPPKDEVYPAVEAVVLQYIQDKGWM